MRTCFWLFKYRGCNGDKYQQNMHVVHNRQNGVKPQLRGSTCRTGGDRYAPMGIDEKRRTDHTKKAPGQQPGRVNPMEYATRCLYREEIDAHKSRASQTGHDNKQQAAEGFQVAQPVPIGWFISSGQPQDGKDPDQGGRTVDQHVAPAVRAAGVNTLFQLIYNTQQRSAKKDEDEQPFAPVITHQREVQQPGQEHIFRDVDVLVRVALKVQDDSHYQRAGDEIERVLPLDPRQSQVGDKCQPEKDYDHKGDLSGKNQPVFAFDVTVYHDGIGDEEDVQNNQDPQK